MTAALPSVPTLLSRPWSPPAIAVAALGSCFVGGSVGAASLRGTAFHGCGVARRQIWCLLQRKDGVRKNVEIGAQSYLSELTLPSSSYGDSVTTSNKLCTIYWSIEADLQDGNFIFITGDPDCLGCWVPDTAMLLVPSHEGQNLWTAALKVPPGIHFKYNYFMRAEGCTDILWRPGPEYSLSVPSFDSGYNNIVVRDAWRKTSVIGLPIQSWGTWLWDSGFQKELPVEQGHSDKDHGGFKWPASSLGHGKDIVNPNKASFLEKKLLDGQHGNCHSLNAKIVKDPVNDRNESLSERDQPVEEPWLRYSIMEAKGTQANVEEEEVQNSSHMKTSIPSTVILINSSVCTMQRIAVLEDGELVELLLEPIKNNVHCDSIYLGVIIQLVPHMGGAFVDIGSRALLSIKAHREPFLFPLHKDDGETVNDCYAASELDPVDTDISVLDDSDIDQLDIEQDDYDDNEEIDIISDSSVNVVDVDDEIYEEPSNQIDHDFSEEAVPLNGLGGSNGSTKLLARHGTKQSHAHINKSKWLHVRNGSKIIVQVIREGIGSKGPTLTPYPKLRSRYWVLATRNKRIGVSKKLIGTERARLKHIAKELRPPGFGLMVRTVAAGHSVEELERDLNSLMSTWKSITEQAKSAALAADEGVEGAVPVMLYRGMDQTLLVAQDYFNDKVKRMVIDSPRTFHEVTSYLEETAPELCNRVELYEKRTPIFDEYNIEAEIDNILCKRVPLLNGGSLVIEETEALVSIDVNGGESVFGQQISQEAAVLEANLAAVKKIAHQIRLRDIGGIIIVDFIDMIEESSKRVVYEEMKKAIEKDRSNCRVSKLSRLSLMEITRKRVRPSITSMISEPCSCCQSTGRLEALEFIVSRIERQIRRSIDHVDTAINPDDLKYWPKFLLTVDRFIYNYLTSGERTKLSILSSSLRVRIQLEVGRGFFRGTFELKPMYSEEVIMQQTVIPTLWSNDARTSGASTNRPLLPIKKWRGRRI